MRRGARTALAVAAVLLAAGCGRCTPTTYVVRPLTLEIVDAETGQPLAGIRVHRVYDTEQYRWSNPMEPAGGRHLLTTFESDRGGRVRLPRDAVRLGGREYFQHEIVYVNLEPAPGFEGWDETPGTRLTWAVLEAWSPDHGDSVVTPAVAHRGYEILSVEWDWDASAQGSPERPRYDVLWNSRGLTRPEETMVVKLRRHGAAPAPRP